MLVELTEVLLEGKSRLHKPNFLHILNLPLLRPVLYLQWQPAHREDGPGGPPRSHESKHGEKLKARREGGEPCERSRSIY
jgi:hypothetical protein